MARTKKKAVKAAEALPAQPQLEIVENIREQEVDEEAEKLEWLKFTLEPKPNIEEVLQILLRRSPKNETNMK